MAKLQLLRDQLIKDEPVRDNFRDIQSYVDSENVLKSEFKHFEFELFTTGEFSFRHRMGFVPLDILVTSLIGDGEITWNHSDFTDQDIFGTASGTITPDNPTTVRLFLGRYSD